jgi:hypothetical protein
MIANNLTPYETTHPGEILKEEIETTCNRNRSVFDYTEVEKGHGRIETRRCEVFEKGLIVDFENRWKGLQSIMTLLQR